MTLIVGCTGRVDEADKLEADHHPPPVLSPPPPPPPPPSSVLNVASQALNVNRIAGERNIVPDDATKADISQSGKDKIVGSYKLCITTEGNISSVTQVKSTDFPAYDQKIMNTIRGEWRYRPFMVNGRATPVCTAVTFIYSQHSPPVLPPARSP